MSDTAWTSDIGKKILPTSYNPLVTGGVPQPMNPIPLPAALPTVDPAVAAGKSFPPLGTSSVPPAPVAGNAQRGSTNSPPMLAYNWLLEHGSFDGAPASVLAARGLLSPDAFTAARDKWAAGQTKRFDPEAKEMERQFTDIKVGKPIPATDNSIEDAEYARQTNAPAVSVAKRLGAPLEGTVNIDSTFPRHATGQVAPAQHGSGDNPPVPSGKHHLANNSLDRALGANNTLKAPDLDLSFMDKTMSPTLLGVVLDALAAGAKGYAGQSYESSTGKMLNQRLELEKAKNQLAAQYAMRIKSLPYEKQLEVENYRKQGDIDKVNEIFVANQLQPLKINQIYAQNYMNVMNNIGMQGFGAKPGLAGYKSVMGEGK